MNALLRQALTISALREARNRVLTNHGCAGVDGQTVDDFAAYGDAALRGLAAEVQGGRYHGQPLLRLWIPKGDGQPPRGLAVPAVRDRVLQTSVATALTPHYGTEPRRWRSARALQPPPAHSLHRRWRAMSWARLWLVAYDVAHPKRLRRVAKLLESVGERQQKSVFELAAGPDERQRITRRLAAIISPEEDQVLLHPCCALCRAGIRWQGRPPGPDHEPFWIV